MGPTVDTGPVQTGTRPEDGAKGVAVDAHGSEPLLAMVLDRTADGVLVADDHGVIVYVNEPLLAMFGYVAADLVGEAIEILLPEGHRADHHRHIGRYRRSPVARSMGRDDLDIEGRRADGSSFSVDIQLSPVPDSALIVAIVRDMTMQRGSAVDLAISKLDLATATTRIGNLQQSLDLVVQGLFALGTSIAAGASNEAVLRERLADAVRGIDEVIDAVQQRRRAAGP
jgi:PAS domain S-box-containing protein